MNELPTGDRFFCPVCFWEDDAVQYDDPSFRGGANVVSLQEARENFRRFGAVEERCLSHVRPPRLDEAPVVTPFCPSIDATLVPEGRV